jgi:hypothetical protein
MSLRAPESSCTEVFDPTGNDWDDLASVTLVDTLESLWIRVERRTTGNRVFVCTSEDVPLMQGLQVPLDVVRTTGETGSSLVTLMTGNPVTVTAWPDPPSVAPGDTAQLHLDVNGGVAPYTYRWVGNVSDKTIANPVASGPGRYYVWVFDAVAEGRTVPLHSSYTVLDVGAILSDTHAVAMPDTIDAGGSARLDLSPHPNSAWWTPNTALSNPYTIDPLASPANTTEYSAVAIYPDGRRDLSVRLTVRLTVDATANPSSIAPGQYSVVRAVWSGGQAWPGNYTFVWSPAHGQNGTFGESRIVHATETTTYRVYAIDGFGQLATDTVTVVVRP